MLSTHLFKQQLDQLYFSPKGRISRALYWKANLTLVFLSVGVSMLMYVLVQRGFLSDVNELYVSVVLTILFWYSAIALLIKRLHDIGWSGWMAIPSILTLVLWLVVGFLQGKQGENKYGENPIEYERDRLYINKNKGIPPPPPPLDNPISKILLALMLFIPIPTFVMATITPVAKNSIQEENQTVNSVSNDEAIQIVDDIDYIVSNKIQETIAELDMQSHQEGYDYSYDLIYSKPSIYKVDLDGDNVFDYVVEAGFCEKTNCHNTTKVFKFYAFKGDSSGKINYQTELTIPVSAEITKVYEDGVISIQYSEYDDNDAHCCPSIVKNVDYELIDGHFVAKESGLFNMFEGDISTANESNSQSELSVEESFVRQIYSNLLVDGYAEPTVLENYGDKDIRDLMYSRNQIQFENGNEYCSWLYGRIVPGNDHDTILEEINFRTLDNGLVQASFQNFGEQQQIDFRVSCDSSGCSLLDFYDPHSFKQDQMKIVENRQC